MLWLALIVPDLPLQVFTRSVDDPGLLAVVETRPRQQILAASEAALAQGVELGGTVAGALAVAPTLALANRDPVLERATLEELAVCCSSFTPSISIASPHSVLLEVSSCLRLFGGPATLAARLRASISDLGLHTAFAVAPTPLAALWLANVRSGTISPRASGWACCLDDIPVRLLGEGSPVSEATLELLHGIGARTMRDVRRLPREGLARRQATEVLRTLGRARGEIPDIRPWYHPPDSFESRLVLPVPMSTSEPLLFAASRLIAGMGAWLESLQAAIDRFTLVLEHEDVDASSIEIITGQPSRDTGRLLMLVREHLAAGTLAAPVEALRLVADSPVSRPGHTPDLFGDPGQTRESASLLLDRLRARLGKHAVGTILPSEDHRPEQAWRPAEPGMKLACTPNAAAAARPAWLLREPRPLASVRDLFLVSGPERIEAGWWDGGDVRRDYFIARTPEGGLWWIFRDLDAAGRWYLHGYFG